MPVLGSSTTLTRNLSLFLESHSSCYAPATYLTIAVEYNYLLLARASDKTVYLNAKPAPMAYSDRPSADQNAILHDVGLALLRVKRPRSPIRMPQNTPIEPQTSISAELAGTALYRMRGE